LKKGRCEQTWQQTPSTSSLSNLELWLQSQISTGMKFITIHCCWNHVLGLLELRGCWSLALSSESWRWHWSRSNFYKFRAVMWLVHIEKFGPPFRLHDQNDSKTNFAHLNGLYWISHEQNGDTYFFKKIYRQSFVWEILRIGFKDLFIGYYNLVDIMIQLIIEITLRFWFARF